MSLAMLNADLWEIVDCRDKFQNVLANSPTWNTCKPYLVQLCTERDLIVQSLHDIHIYLDKIMISGTLVSTSWQAKYLPLSGDSLHYSSCKSSKSFMSLNLNDLMRRNMNISILKWLGGIMSSTGAASIHLIILILQVSWKQQLEWGVAWRHYNSRAHCTVSVVSSYVNGFQVASHDLKLNSHDTEWLFFIAEMFHSIPFPEIYQHNSLSRNQCKFHLSISTIWDTPSASQMLIDILLLLIFSNVVGTSINANGLQDK